MKPRVGVRVSCIASQHIHHIRTQHGGLTGPPSVTVARPLLAPHFLDPSFFGLSVTLAFSTGLLPLRLCLSCTCLLLGRQPLDLFDRGLLLQGHIYIIVVVVVVIIFLLLFFLRAFLLLFVLLPGEV